jgi:AcrR family transcriptional regulator
MTSATTLPSADRRPLRADARRNYDKLITAAREAFGEVGSSASLEDIARQAGVGIGTLYRHFPTRQALIEAVYVDQVDTLCASAVEFGSLPPWEGFSGWLHNFVGYMATKRALRDALIASLGRDSEFFGYCRDVRSRRAPAEAGSGGGRCPRRRNPGRRDEAGRRYQHGSF